MNSLSQDLLEFRLSIARYSLPAAKSRLQIEHTEKAKPKVFAAVGSVPCDSRLPMGVKLDDSQNEIIIAGWSGEVSKWSISGSQLASFSYHTDRVQCLDYKEGLIASGGFDNRVFVNGPSLVELVGHSGRVNSVIWSKVQKYLFTCSHDMTWKTWDTEYGKCIFTQEGHARGVYSLAQHPDASLLATSDLAGVSALWDLRTGKHLLTLKDHSKKVLCCEFGKNGYLLLTGSEDNTLKVWDIRKKNLLYTIPAHTKLVSCLGVSENTIFSGSYDGTVKLWKISDFSLLQTLTHNTKVTDLDLDLSGEVLVTTSFDRTFKIWTALSVVN